MTWQTAARVALLMVFTPALAGCFGGPEEFAADVCESLVQNAMKSPSSYQQVKRYIDSGVDEKKLSVTIIYDASNSFGVLLRGSAICNIQIDCNQRKSFCVKVTGLVLDGERYPSERLSIRGTSAAIRVADRGWIDRVRSWVGW